MESGDRLGRFRAQLIADGHRADDLAVGLDQHGRGSLLVLESGHDPRQGARFDVAGAAEV